MKSKAKGRRKMLSMFKPGDAPTEMKPGVYGPMVSHRKKTMPRGRGRKGR